VAAITTETVSSSVSWCRWFPQWFCYQLSFSPIAVQSWAWIHKCHLHSGCSLQSKQCFPITNCWYFNQCPISSWGGV